MTTPPPAAAPPTEGAPRPVRATLVTWLLITSAVLLPLALMLRPFAVSVVTGGILSVLFQPLFDRAHRRLPRWASGLVVTLGVLLLVLVPVALLVVGAIRQGADALAQLSDEATPTIPELLETVRSWVPFTDALGTPDEINAILMDGLGSLSQAASQLLFVQMQAVPAIFLQLVIIVLSTYFMLVDGPRLFSWVAEKVPLSTQIRAKLVSSFRVAANAVVLASVAAAGAQSLILLIAFWLLGLPAALFAASAAFVLAWIPPLGAAPIWLSAAIYFYLQGAHVKAAIMLGVGALVAVVDNVVRPLVLRGRQEMHPMVSLLAILGGLAFFGLPGLFIGPLLASMAIAVLDIWPAVASYSGIPVSGAGEEVPEVPMLSARHSP